ncbi:MAG: SDR family NAD(P)-dependent oxidoreductase [Pseudomonadota bacterium]
MESFGPQMRALVVGSSGGLGSALVQELSKRGVRVTQLSRSSDPTFDLCDEVSILEATNRLTEKGPFDLIFDATGTLEIDGVGPEKSLSALDPAIMARSYMINAVGPALLLKHFVDLLPRSGRCAFATLSARVGSIGDNRLGGWYSYRASTAARNQVMHSAAVEVARKRPEAVILCLHPGTVATRLTSGYARGHTHPPEEAARRLLDVIDASGPDRSGGFFAYDGSEIVW